MESESVPEPILEPSPEASPVGSTLLPSDLEALPFRPARHYYQTEETAPDAVASTRIPRWIIVSTIALAGLLAHGLCVRSAFYFEDWTQIVSNEIVQYGAWWDAGLRSLTYFTYWLTYALFGFSSPAYHLGNLGLHLLVAVLVAGFGRLLLVETAGLPPDRARRTGWWAGLLFAVHPLGSEVLNYARWRDIELVTLFTLLAMRSAIRWRRQRRPGFGWAAAVLLAVSAATFCKEVGFLLAAGGAWLVWLRTPPPPAYETRRGVAMPLPQAGPTTAVKTKLVATPKDAAIAKGNWPVALSLALVALCMAALAWPLWAEVNVALHHPRLGWHTLTKSRVFWMCLWRTIVPVRLCSDHQIAWTVGLGDKVAWASAATELLAILGAGWLYFRRSAWARTTGILLSLIMLDIVHRLANPNAELMVEARMYPALVPVCVLLAWGLDRLANWRWDVRSTPRPWLGTGLALALAGAGIVLSARRAQKWHDTTTLVADIVAQYPMQARAWQELQDADVRNGYWTETLKDQPPVRGAIERAMNSNLHSEDRKFFPGGLLLTHLASEGNYALALAKLGHPREAAEHLAEVQTSMPKSGEFEVSCRSEFLLARGLVKEAVGELDGAMEDLKTSQKLTGNQEASRELRRIWREQQAKAPAYW